MSARIATAPSLTANQPQLLFEGAYDKGKICRPAYDVTADGTRFLMVKTDEKESAPTELVIVLEWFEEMKSRARN